MPLRGPQGAYNKKKSQPSNHRRVTTQRGCSTLRRRPRPPTGPNGKANGTNRWPHKRQFGKAKKEQALMIATEENAYQLRSEQVTTTIENKLIQVFGFVADPKKTLLHNASSALVNTPTWYYFSRPSHLAFHDFTQQKQAQKFPTFAPGSWTQIYPDTTSYKHMEKFGKNTIPKFQRAIHLRFHFVGTTNSSDEPYNPKMYVQSNWTLPTGRNHLLSCKSISKNSNSHWINYSKNKLESRTYSHIRHAPYNHYNRISSSSLAIKTLGQRFSNATTTSTSQ